MKGKIFSIVALVLLVLGTMIVSGAEEDASSDATTFSFLTDGEITPMASGCNYVCAKCLKYGLSGACTARGACC